MYRQRGANTPALRVATYFARHVPAHYSSTLPSRHSTGADDQSRPLGIALTGLLTTWVNAARVASLPGDLVEAEVPEVAYDFEIGAAAPAGQQSQ